jgi:hypothetical protein
VLCGLGTRQSRRSDCLVIDGSVNPNIDIVVDIAPIGKCTCQKSVVRIRYILLPTQDSLCEEKSKQLLLVEDFRIITLHNTLVRKRVRKGTARANGGDFGDMHAMGTHVPCDGEGLQVVEYAANSKVPRKFFRKFVKLLGKIGAILFQTSLPSYKIWKETQVSVQCHQVGARTHTTCWLHHRYVG